MSAAPTRQAGVLAGTPLGREAPGLDLCVHCGFCLQSCPTYLVLEDENDSPRGRLLLMRAAVEGTLPIEDPDLSAHLDRCLGCRACETACPSGVPYGRLLEAARSTMADRRPVGRLNALILLVMGNATLRSVVFAVARFARAMRLASLLRRLPGRTGFAFAMLESTRPALARRAPSRGTGAGLGDAGEPPPPAVAPPARARVAILEGCVMKGLFAHTNRATERVLARNGFVLAPAAGQACCGALHAHAGEGRRAQALARRNISAFEASGAELVAVNAAGCGAMMKEYGHLLAGDPVWRERAARFAERVRDVSELLAMAGPATAGPVPLRVTYDAPCHLHHAQRVTEAPLAVLGAITGLDLVPLADADRCCGGAGSYNLTQPAVSWAVLQAKLDHVRDTGASLVATGNPGCHLQLGAGLLARGAATRCVHPVELLDHAYGGPAA